MDYRPLWPTDCCQHQQLLIKGWLCCKVSTHSSQRATENLPRKQSWRVVTVTVQRMDWFCVSLVAFWLLQLVVGSNRTTRPSIDIDIKKLTNNQPSKANILATVINHPQFHGNPCGNEHRPTEIGWLILYTSSVLWQIQLGKISHQ